MAKGKKATPEMNCSILNHLSTSPRQFRGLSGLKLALDVKIGYRQAGT
jgi:hypothetical protein